MPVRIYAPLTVPPVNTNPGDAEEGSLWWRADRDQLAASDGNPGRLLTIGPTGNLPVVQSGSWHSVPPYGNFATMTPVNNRAYALPLWPGQSTTLTGVAAEVTLLGVGNLRAGLYISGNTNTPSTLLQDFGTVSTGLAGVKTWTGFTQNIRPLLYWLVIVQQGLITVGLRARDTWDPIVSETTPVLNANRNAYYADGVSGALPGTFPAVAGTTQGPSAMVQFT